MEWRHWIYGIRARLRAILGTMRADQDIDDEVSFHLAMQTRENQHRGMGEVEARRNARLTLGGIEQTKEAGRDVHPLHGVQTFARDLRYAVRLIRRSPGFSVVMVLTVALGIGANTAIFSIVNAVLLRPLPYAEPARLVRVYLANPAQDITDGRFSVPEVDDWQARSRALTSFSGAISIPMILTGQGEPTEHQVAIVVGDLFATLGVRARTGRALTLEDERQGLRNAVISERLWTTRFARDPAILGRTIVMGAMPYTIVGVMPADVRYPESATDLWSPESILPDESLGPRVRSQRQFEALARLAPGATLEQAQNEVNSIAAQLASEFPGTNKGWSAARVIPVRDTIVGSVDTALVVVLAVVGVILLIACANLANMLLARGTSRAHELATRVALGAGRMRILRQLLTESLVLGLLGGVLGIALSAWGVQTVLALSAGTLPRIEEVRVDRAMIAFGLLLAIATSLLFGILPALRSLPTPQEDLRRGRGTIGGSGRLRGALVVAQVALAVILVIAAGLMGRNLLQLRSVQPGFDPERTLAVTIQYNLAGATGDIGQLLVQRREQILQRIASLPGVVAAGSITRLPLESACSDTLVFLRADGTGSRDGTALRAANCLISPDYIAAMRIPLVRGEPLPARWPDGAPYPFLISEAAARRFWPGQDPVGQIVRANYGGRAIVVGIVGDVRQNGLAEEAPPVVYFNQRTAPRIVTNIVVRTAGDPMLLAESIRAAVRDIDPDQPIRSICTLRDVLSESIARDRFFTLLFALFGALALVLAAVGVYGVLAYSVGQRTREIGVRIALGAQVGDVLRMVVREGMALVVAGVVVGAIVSLAVTRALGTLLHEISTHDPLTFLVAPAVLLMVALLACYLPARRATRVEAVTALRSE
jgi:predicted permease